MIKFVQKKIQNFTYFFYLRGLLKILYVFRYFFKNNSSEYTLKNGNKVFLNLDDYFEGTHLWNFYEISCLHIINTLLKKGDSFVDIGTNKGFISLQALSIIGSEGHVFCFEPNIELNSYIKKNFKINSFQNFTIVNQPLSNIKEKVKFAVGKQHAFSKIITMDETKFDVEKYLDLDTLKFDEYIYNSVENIKNISLVKIDAEGHDIKIILGMKKFLSNSKPSLIFEYSNDQSAYLNELNKIINTLDYKIYLVSDNIKDKVLVKKEIKLRKLNCMDLKDIKYSDVFLVHKDNYDHIKKLRIY